jgi:hypothetical protein
MVSERWIPIGGYLAFIGSIMIFYTQIYMVQIYLELSAAYPLYPPEAQPGIELVLQLILISIIAAVSSGIMLLVSGVIIFRKSGAIGGFLAILFAIPALVTTGIIGIIGAILAIIGGILAMAPSLKRPEKQGHRKSKQ